MRTKDKVPDSDIGSFSVHVSDGLLAANCPASHHRRGASPQPRPLFVADATSWEDLVLADYDKQPGAKRRHGSSNARDRFKLAAKRSYSARKMAAIVKLSGRPAKGPKRHGGQATPTANPVAATTPVARAKATGEERGDTATGLRVVL